MKLDYKLFFTVLYYGIDVMYYLQVSRLTELFHVVMLVTLCLELLL
jgi:hypothetical protein